jgi:hypothetical protein
MKKVTLRELAALQLKARDSFAPLSPKAGITLTSARGHAAMQ